MNYPARYSRHHGFTLLELLIVMFIISLVSMVALPSYKNYMIRTKVGAEMVHFSPIKSAITFYYNMHGTLPTSNSDAKLPKKNDITGDYLKSVEIKSLVKDKGKSAGKGKGKNPKPGASSIQVIMTYDRKKLPELENKMDEVIFTVEENA